jgi:hypothetical protein
LLGYTVIAAKRLKTISYSSDEVPVEVEVLVVVEQLLSAAHG